jgi:hypothetical protein
VVACCKNTARLRVTIIPAMIAHTSALAITLNDSMHLCPEF